MRTALATAVFLFAAAAATSQNRGWPYDQPPFEEGCHYGTGTDCSAFCTSPKTHWSIEIQGCIPDDPEMTHP